MDMDRKVLQALLGAGLVGGWVLNVSLFNSCLSGIPLKIRFSSDARMCIFAFRDIILKFQVLLDSELYRSVLYGTSKLCGTFFATFQRTVACKECFAALSPFFTCQMRYSKRAKVGERDFT